MDDDQHFSSLKPAESPLLLPNFVDDELKCITQLLISLICYLESQHFCITGGKVGIPFRHLYCTEEALPGIKVINSDNLNSKIVKLYGGDAALMLASSQFALSGKISQHFQSMIR